MAEEIGIRDFKNRATEIIRQVRAGREYVITVNGRPAAVVRPVDDRPRRTPEEIEHDLQVLERIRTSAGRAAPGTPSVVDSLVADREARERALHGEGLDGSR
jgi:prevent-host-death family protein